MIAAGFSWFHLIPAVDHDTLVPYLHGHTYAFLSAWTACLVVCVCSVLTRAAS